MVTLGQDEYIQCPCSSCSFNLQTKDSNYSFPTLFSLNVHLIQNETIKNSSPVKKVAKINNHEIETIAKVHKSLSIQEFINVTNFDIEPLKLNRDWHCIENDYVILDDEMVRMLSDGKRIDNARVAVKKILNNPKFKIEYVEKDYFELLSIGRSSDIWVFENTEDKNLKKRKFISLSIESFKELCMICDSKQSSKIRKYFIALEKLFKYYVYYQQKTTELNREDEFKQKEIEYEKKIEQKAIEFDKFKSEQIAKIKEDIETLSQMKGVKESEGYIYIVSSIDDAKEGHFKYGITNNLEARLSSYNSGRPQEKPMRMLFSTKVHNAKYVEDRLNIILSGLKSNKRKEYVRLPFVYLQKIIESICLNFNSETYLLGDAIKIIGCQLSTGENAINWTQGIATFLQKSESKKSTIMLLHNIHKFFLSIFFVNLFFKKKIG
jgi:phage anti-repressor protein